MSENKSLNKENNDIEKRQDSLNSNKINSNQSITQR